MTQLQDIQLFVSVSACDICTQTHTWGKRDKNGEGESGRAGFGVFLNGVTRAGSGSLTLGTSQWRPDVRRPEGSAFAFCNACFRVPLSGCCHYGCSYHHSCYRLLTSEPSCFSLLIWTRKSSRLSVPEQSRQGIWHRGPHQSGHILPYTTTMMSWLTTEPRTRKPGPYCSNIQVYHQG